MTRRDARYSIETRAVHGARPVDESSGAVTPAINLSTTFVRDEDGKLSGFDVKLRRID